MNNLPHKPKNRFQVILKQKIWEHSFKMVSKYVRHL